MPGSFLVLYRAEYKKDNGAYILESEHKQVLLSGMKRTKQGINVERVWGGMDGLVNLG